MPVLPAARRALTLILIALCPATVAACGSAVSTTGFQGAQHEVAVTVANLQTDATAGEQAKICASDVSAAVVRRLGGSKGCEAAIKSQLAEVDSLELSVQSIHIAPGGNSATASVKSTYGGKTRAGTVSLVKEGGKWKISGVQ